MKKTVLILLCLLILFGSFSVVASGESACDNWFCVHVKGHVQPRIDGSLSYCRQYGAYYLDDSHSAYTDDEKVIYLTFDAGYENGNVEKILDVLKSEKVTGAFFILENLVKSNPDLVKRMGDEGHLVCNHTAHHKDMTKLDAEEFAKELRELETVYTQVTGKELSRFYRPPEGKFNAENLKTAQSMGYKTVFWSFGYPDWDNQKQMPKEKAMSVILSNIHNGEVMLLHPTSKTNADLLGDLIQTLKADGFRFGNLFELCGGSES